MATGSGTGTASSAADMSTWIAVVRRMVDEPSSTTYSDAGIQYYIEKYPLLDERGEVPYTWDTSTSPPTQDENEDWIPTYDLNAAAADIWDEKAAGVAEDFNFSADGGRYDRSQVAEAYGKRARYYRARRSAATVKMVMSPDPDSEEDGGWVVNT